MTFAIMCVIDRSAIATLKKLRARHLEYIAAHREEILFGGPMRSPDGLPHTMLIIVKTDDPAAAEAFIQAEPYTHSKQVFSEVVVRPWSQVVPDLFPGALEYALEEERRSHDAV